MVILERAEEFHRHVDDCVVCTAGCREAIFCVRGWRLLLGAMDEAFALAERGVAANLAAQPPAIAVAEIKPARQVAERPDRQKPGQKRPAANGLASAADRLRRTGEIQELAPSDSVALEGGAS